LEKKDIQRAYELEASLEVVVVEQKHGSGFSNNDSKNIVFEESQSARVAGEPWHAEDVPEEENN
jgi:hypothetical protein